MQHLKRTVDDFFLALINAGAQSFHDAVFLFGF
jgi:hypothetical protein